MPDDSTLIVHTGGIGDFLLALPAIAQLPPPIDLAGIPDRLELAVAAGLARRVYNLDTLEFHTLFTAPSETLRNFLGSYTHVIVFMRDSDGTIEQGLQFVGVPRVDVFPGLPDAGWTDHATAYYDACLGTQPSPPLHLPIPAEGTPLDIVIHPGSGSLAKNWPHFPELTQMLHETGREVTWCLGPAETERNFCSHLDVSLLQCVKLVHLAARLKTADLYVGNDSGITHLAAALGVPTVAVFGPTDPRVWAPRGGRVTVVAGAGWPTASEVLAAVVISLQERGATSR